MKLVSFAAAVALVILAAAPAQAQQAATSQRPAAASIGAGDTAAVVVSPELRQALDELAATLDALGRRIANDPEMRMAGVRVAQGMVGAAQLLVEMQTDILRVVLQRAADRLATLPVPESSR
jgi:hypothetical protein